MATGSGRYAWADDDDLAWTVAVVDGRTVPEVLAGYGTDGDLGELDFQAALDVRNEHFDEFAVVQVRSADRLLLIEPNGWKGSEPETAAELSAGGATFFSVYWSPVATRILQAADGKVTGFFEPTLIGESAGSGDLLPGWVEPDDFPLETLNSACLAAMERQTGVAFDRAWLEVPAPTFRIAG